MRVPVDAANVHNETALATSMWEATAADVAAVNNQRAGNATSPAPGVRVVVVSSTTVTVVGAGGVTVQPRVSSRRLGALPPAAAVRRLDSGTATCDVPSFPDVATLVAQGVVAGRLVVYVQVSAPPAICCDTPAAAAALAALADAVLVVNANSSSLGSGRILAMVAIATNVSLASFGEPSTQAASLVVVYTVVDSDGGGSGGGGGGSGDTVSGHEFRNALIGAAFGFAVVGVLLTLAGVWWCRRKGAQSEAAAVAAALAAAGRHDATVRRLSQRHKLAADAGLQRSESFGRGDIRRSVSGGGDSLRTPTRGVLVSGGMPPGSVTRTHTGRSPLNGGSAATDARLSSTRKMPSSALELSRFAPSSRTNTMPGGPRHPPSVGPPIRSHTKRAETFAAPVPPPLARSPSARGGSFGTPGPAPLSHSPSMRGSLGAPAPAPLARSPSMRGSFGAPAPPPLTRSPSSRGVAPPSPGGRLDRSPSARALPPPALAANPPPPGALARAPSTRAVSASPQLRVVSSSATAMRAAELTPHPPASPRAGAPLMRSPSARGPPPTVATPDTFLSDANSMYAHGGRVASSRALGGGGSGGGGGPARAPSSRW